MPNLSFEVLIGNWLGDVGFLFFLVSFFLLFKINIGYTNLRICINKYTNKEKQQKKKEKIESMR